MAIKIRKKRRDNKDRKDRNPSSQPDFVEVGQGDFCVMTVNRHDGSTVVHRFETAEEANAQLERNVEADKPLVGVTDPN